MKNIFVLVASILLVVSCSKNNIVIDGAIAGDKHDGQTMYLYYTKSASDFNAFELLSSAIIEDGKFSYELNIDEALESELPTVGFLTLEDKDKSYIEEDSIIKDSPIATFILEKGEIRVQLEGSSVRLSGTVRNNRFNEIHSSLEEYVNFARLTADYDSIIDIPLDDEGRDGWTRLKLLDNNLKGRTFEFTKENMSNNVGEFLFLKSYNDNLFTPAQLKDLIGRSSEKFRQRADVMWLKDILEQMGTDPSYEMDMSTGEEE